jgi:hypothetical protein
LKPLQLFLKLGDAGICLTFSNPTFRQYAPRHICLSETFSGTPVGYIEYKEDANVSRAIQVPCAPNAVYVEKENLARGIAKTYLRLYDKYSIAINIENEHVTVYHPENMPLRLLLDDVLQAALQPILQQIGGFILHGSCVVRDKTAVVFLGNSGSGKSSTAFNLRRFGFYCFADDAVPITLDGNNLWAWPMAREFSIRPLIFKLFKRQGIQVSDYQRDGEKYYFGQNSGKFKGAQLKYICFVEPSGEADSIIATLTYEETLALLLKENRHFSFMDRPSAAEYSQILAAKVPTALKAEVGIDFNAQAKAFEMVFAGKAALITASSAAITANGGRKSKMSRIRTAWSAPGKEPLQDIIPLLGDFDLKVFTLALGFFQNYPPASLEILAPPAAAPALPRHFEASWLRSMDWLDGTRQLVRETGVEVFQRFAFSWIKSAPLIYPFLKILTLNDSEKCQQVESAWIRYTEEKTQIDDPSEKPVEFHLSPTNAVILPDNSTSNSSWYSTLSSGVRNLHVYFWLESSRKSPWRRWSSLTEGLVNAARFIMVPVGRRGEAPYKISTEFIEWAHKKGLKPKLSRYFPFCCLDDATAQFLISADAVETQNDFGYRERYLYTVTANEGKTQPPAESIREVPWPNTHAGWLEKPFPVCTTCGDRSLGLCRGGFFI